MAAYEILLLNTAIPQIQAAQSGDTYVVPRDIAFSTVANLANGTNLLPSLTFSSDTNTGIYREGADALGFTAGGGTNQMVLTTTGLGLGTSSPGYKLDVAGKISYNGAIGEGTDNTLSSSGTTLILGESATWTILQLRTGGTERMRLDSSGNLGLGVTPSAWSGYTALQVGSGFTAWSSGVANARINANTYYNGGYKYVGTGTATMYEQDGYHAWYTAPSGTADGTAATALTSAQNGNSYTIKVAGTTDFTLIGAANNNVGTVFTKSGGTGAGTGTVSQNISFTQAMTLDASGNLQIGTTNTYSGLTRLIVESGEVRNTYFRSSRASGSYLEFGLGASGATIGSVGAGGQIITSGATADLALRAESNLVFAAGGATERARITSGGYFKASNTGAYTGISSSYHEFYQTADSVALFVRATNGSYTSSVLEINGDRATTNATYNLINAYNGPISGQFIVRDSGNAVNTTGTYGTISDQKLKQDIVDAGSQWADIKAVRFRKFKMKNDSTGLLQLGVVAQELEQTSPGLVEEHTDRDREGNDLGTTTKSVKTSVLLMKAAVALQEAMARIEKLEAEVAALKGA